jgi:multiple antibiotic resistance protein
VEQHLQAIATLISLVNPAVCAMIFAGLVQGQPRATALAAATKVVVVVTAVLLVAAFAGSPILKAFGISLDAFSVAGGIVLMFIGFSMLKGSSSPSTPESLEHKGDVSEGLGRLILFAASPGTMTGVITIAAAHDRDHFPITAVVAVVVVMAITFAVLALTTGRGSSKGPGLGQQMASRYMGLIIVAMGLQFALTGYKAFMA